jgi:hypothetical protein
LSFSYSYLCLSQLEEWEADPSPGQLSLVEALREVLTALIKDLSRRYRILWAECFYTLG